MKNVRMTICLVAAVLVMVAGQGLGTIEFKDGGTYNINYPVCDDVWVDYQAPGMQTTVNFLAGAEIPHPYTLQGYNNSRFNISGGYLSYLDAYDSSQVTILLGGWVGGYVFPHSSSKVVMSGGFVSN